MAISVYDKIKDVLDKRGITVFVQTDTNIGKELPCPCLKNNPWNTYDRNWHIKNPNAPDCFGTGIIYEQNDDVVAPVEEKKAIRAFVLPRYGEAGLELEMLLNSQNFNWSWIAVTQDRALFNILWVEDENGVMLHKFVVKNEMPYYIDDNTTIPVVTIYTLIPIFALRQR